MLEALADELLETGDTSEIESPISIPPHYTLGFPFDPRSISLDRSR